MEKYKKILGVKSTNFYICKNKIQNIQKYSKKIRKNITKCKKYIDNGKVRRYNTIKGDKGDKTMKKMIDDSRLMIKVCDLYYNQDISQQQIAKMLGLSRPTISKLLSLAREQGIVQIKIVNLDTIEYWQLERELEEKYGLNEVRIVRGGETEEESKDALGSMVARYLRRKIKEGNTVGVSMGSTLYHMVSQMENLEKEESEFMNKAENVTFVPLVGGVGQLRMELHSNSLAERLSRFYGGKFIPLHAPARVSSKSIRDELMKEESVLAAIRQTKHLDIAVVGIGYPNENSAIKATGYFKENEIDSLIERKVAGELCMQFYDIFGDTSAYSEDNTVIGVDIHKLTKVPCSIGVAGGMEKLPAIKGAIKGRYINTLITDVQCANALASDK